MVKIENHTSFKEVMSHWASGVAIISTTDENNKPHGLTVSSFNSASLVPELILFSISQHSHTLDIILSAEKFAVNILNVNQQHIADICSKKVDDKFTHFEYVIGNFSPLITGAICHMECSLEHCYEAGDHRIIVGRVLSLSVNNTLAPLVYHSRGYKSLLEQ